MSTAGTKGVPRAERETQILDVAANHIAHVGYAGLSINDIATRAGISKPLIYSYFHTKDGLYTACVERAGANLGHEIENVVTGSEHNITMAHRTLKAIFTALEPRPADWNVIFDRSVPRDSEAGIAATKVRRSIAAQAQRGSANVLNTAGITDPLDVSAFSEVWMGVVTSLVNWWLRHPSESASDMTARSERLIAAIR
ncbi:TetR/AcrR family transcriptional regulator [Hoyosella rhizosphaerae]|uniref:HTH tetR-type domain-containing protein n=1 Tax=Hoyosella rhizosphaerae TaxID=1755582 RepID=A0A916U2P2_9ACTN|nr:TetR/AcrR family transcriptional regulator [Hoyosella rhizosphaerae]MBN4926589.1 TetR/AcrR family transcriptional regulator [Hoyosella rhizosphaerae]GGC58076.1 hypothetical protein GCM10011410_08190 [Hoyosella rhizosphaerae]